MHASSTHATGVSDFWLVWVGGFAGHPVHLTVHSITVAHKLLQDYKPAWAACRLRMWMHSSSSSCPHLAFFPFLFSFSFGISADKCRTVSSLRVTSFLVSTAILFDLSNRVMVEIHKQRKYPKTSGLTSLNTHCWRVLMNPGFSFFHLWAVHFAQCSHVWCKHTCMHSFSTQKNARKHKLHGKYYTHLLCWSVKHTQAHTHSRNLSLSLPNAQQGCTQRVFSPSFLFLLSLSRVHMIATDVGSNLYRWRRLWEIPMISHKGGFKSGGTTSMKKSWVEWGEGVGVLRAWYKTVVSFQWWLKRHLQSTLEHFALFSSSLLFTAFWWKGSARHCIILYSKLNLTIYWQEIWHFLFVAKNSFSIKESASWQDKEICT